MPFYSSDLSTIKPKVTQWKTNRGVSTNVVLTLINDEGIVIVANNMKDSGNYNFILIDNDNVLTELYSSQRTSDPRGGMTVYSFKGGKGKTIEFQIPFPNADWAYGAVSACEIS